MAKIEINKQGMAKLEKELQATLQKTEKEANKAAAHQPTPAAKARAFARVLRNHGVEDVNEAELRKRFQQEGATDGVE